jgi:hypothetical protein
MNMYGVWRYSFIIRKVEGSSPDEDNDLFSIYLILPVLLWPIL